MSENPLTLFCLVDGEATSNAFSVKVPLSGTVDDLKELIKIKKTPELDDIAADKLTLWRVSYPVITTHKHQPVLLSAIDSSTELEPTDDIADIFQETLPKKTIHILVQHPSLAEKIKRKLEQDPQYMPQYKKIRITEAWAPYTASDGNLVDLPPSWINILASSELVPEPRAAFAHLLGDLHAGMAINMPRLGQTPKQFYSASQFFITEQMLEMWNEVQNGVVNVPPHVYRRVLSGPMGVGKSFLSYFLAARAYAEGWPLLYLADAGALDVENEENAAMFVVTVFLAQNKDILTAAELESLVQDYDGTHNLPMNAIYVILTKILRQREQSTLLIIDEHGKLYREPPFVPVRFKSLNPFGDFHAWPEDCIGAHVVFTGTAHAKFEEEILEDCYKANSLVFVGPLSEHVFLQLLTTFPDLNRPEYRDAVRATTNCVPRELVQLSSYVEQNQLAWSEALEGYQHHRMKQFFNVAEVYYRSLKEGYFRTKFFKALFETFIGGTRKTEFQCNFLDLGMVYRRKEFGKGTTFQPLCAPAHNALLELFMSMPLSEDIRKCLQVGARLSGEQFEQALFHQLLRNTKPVLLSATDLNNKHSQTISLDFDDWGTIEPGNISLGPDHKRTLSRGYTGYPRFDYMVGPIFIQASVSSFAKHNTDSAEIQLAFQRGENNEPNQVETYLDHMFGPGHSAMIDEDTKRFVVAKNGERVPGFRIVYVQGTPGAPTHAGHVKNFPDVAHISFEEIKETLFANI